MEDYKLRDLRASHTFLRTPTNTFFSLLFFFSLPYSFASKGQPLVPRRSLTSRWGRALRLQGWWVLGSGWMNWLRARRREESDARDGGQGHRLWKDGAMCAEGK